MSVDVYSCLVYGFYVNGDDIVHPNFESKDFIRYIIEPNNIDIHDSDAEDEINECWMEYIYDNEYVIQENGYIGEQDSKWYVGIPICYEGIVRMEKITSLDIQDEAAAYDALYDIVGKAAFDQEKYQIHLYLVTLWH